MRKYLAGVGIVILVLAVLYLIPAKAAPHQVILNWTPPTVTGSSPLTGFNIYRGTTMGGPYTRIAQVSATQTSYTDNNVTSGVTYYYVVTATNSTDESANSNEAKAVIPQAPGPPGSVTATVQ